MIIIFRHIQYNLESKNITILKPMSIYQIYEQIKHDFMDDDNLMTYTFPIEIIDYAGNYKMINGWSMIDSRNII